MMHKKTTTAIAMICFASLSAAQQPRPAWRSVEASNGQVYMVNMASVQRFENGASYANGVLSATAFMYEDQGDSNGINRQRMYIFDCHGHMQDALSMSGPTYIAPRSVAAKVAELVCAVQPPVKTNRPAQPNEKIAVTTPGMYAQYVADPVAAGAKYEGLRVEVKGKVVSTQFADAGLGHIRMVLADGGGKGTSDSIILCFTESCASMRYPTVTDEQFKAVKVGGFVRATCTVEAAAVSAKDATLVNVNLSQCSMP